MGVFTISLVSNSVPFVGVPYLLLVASYIAREAIRFGVPVEVALILTSALGATLGKLIVYFVAAGFRLKLSEATKDNLKYFTKYTKKMAFPLIILFSATPSPDDVLYVPLGVARYPLAYYFLGVFIGKAIMVWLASMYFRVLFKYLGDEIATNPVIALCVALLTIYLTAIILRMNWKNVADTYSEMGALKSFKTLFKEFFVANAMLFKKLFSAASSVRRRS